MIEKGVDATGKKAARAAASLEAACRRNLATMRRPDFADGLQCVIP